MLVSFLAFLPSQMLRKKMTYIKQKLWEKKSLIENVVHLIGQGDITQPTSNHHMLYLNIVPLLNLYYTRKDRLNGVRYGSFPRRKCYNSACSFGEGLSGTYGITKE